MLIEWVETWPNWLQALWFFYVTFHDLIQWGVLLLIGMTAWGQQRQKKQLEEIVEHVHEELHNHMSEDALFHEDLGQNGMYRGG